MGIRSLMASAGLVLGLSSATYAHLLDAPTTVQADADGHFAYDVVAHFGPGDAVVASWHWIGIQNVTDGLWADCFCNPGCRFEEGTVLVEHVEGQLDDPNELGIVENGVEFCDGAPLIANTTIEPVITAVDEQTPGGPVVGLTTSPNPVRLRAVFTFALARETRVRLRIYDVTGRLTATIQDGQRSAGTHTVAWSPEDVSGSLLTSGTYFAVLDAGEAIVVDRFTVVR